MELKRVALVAVAAFSFLMGAATSAVAQSPYQNTTVKVHPPVGSADGVARMNCGWHTTCASPYLNDGPGIDWHHTSPTCCGTGRNVYYRSWNTVPGASVDIGRIQILNWTMAACYETRTRIRDQSDVVVGTVIHQHTERTSDSVTFNLVADPAGVYSGNRLASLISTDDKCDPPFWTGPHVHQKHADGYAAFTKNVGAPPGAIRRQSECPPNLPCKYTYLDPGAQTGVWERRITYQVYICALDPLC